MASRKHRFLWVTDPWETLDHEKDTTLKLALEAAAQGYESFWCDVHSIRMEDSKIVLDAAPVNGLTPPFPARVKLPKDFSSIHYRVDPPVDLAYLHPLQLLVLAGAKVVNPAPILFAHNEKLEGFSLKNLMPETLVSSRWDDLARFGKKLQKTVLKPLHQAQSKGVALLSWTSSADLEKNREILGDASDQFSRPVLMQRYLAGIENGEQRLWFLDGKLLACVRKMPLGGDFRVNIDGGSALKATTLNSAEKKASREIGSYLRANKIRLAAVDLIDGFVTDFNFTSPGLITQMEAVLDKNLARPIIKALVK